MGFWSEGRLASTNHRFPIVIWFCKHIPCHRTPAPNNLPGFNSFKGPAIKSHNGLGSRLANKLQGDTSETKLTSKHSRHCPTEGFILGSHFQRFQLSSHWKAFPIHCEVTRCTSVKKRNRSLSQRCTPTWRWCRSCRTGWCRCCHSDCLQCSPRAEKINLLKYASYSVKKKLIWFEYLELSETRRYLWTIQQWPLR